VFDGLRIARESLCGLGALVGITPATAELAAVELLFDVIHPRGRGRERGLGECLHPGGDRLVLLQHAGNQRLDVPLELIRAGHRFRCVFDELADVGKALVGSVLQRFDVVADRLDLALGVSQHVFDIGHVCLLG